MSIILQLELHECDLKEKGAQQKVLDFGSCLLCSKESPFSLESFLWQTCDLASLRESKRGGTTGLALHSFRKWGPERRPLRPK